MSEPGPAAFHRSGTVSRSLLSVTAFTLARPRWRGQRVSESRTSAVVTGRDQYAPAAEQACQDLPTQSIHRVTSGRVWRVAAKCPLCPGTLGSRGSFLGEPSARRV